MSERPEWLYAVIGAAGAVAAWFLLGPIFAAILGVVLVAAYVWKWGSL